MIKVSRIQRIESQALIYLRTIHFLRVIYISSSRGNRNLSWPSKYSRSAPKGIDILICQRTGGIKQSKGQKVKEFDLYIGISWLVGILASKPHQSPLTKFQAWQLFSNLVNEAKFMSNLSALRPFPFVHIEDGWGNAMFYSNRLPIKGGRLAKWLDLKLQNTAYDNFWAPMGIIYLV